MNYNKNQQYLLLSGGTWAIFDALTSSFLVAFALIFGASNFVIGFLGAMPYLVSLIIELPGAKLVEYFDRKTICVIAQGISRISWILMILVPYFFTTNPLLAITLFFAWIKLAEIITEPALTSLLADLVPLKIRGRFFGFRNTLIGIAGMTTAIIAGFYLDLFPKNNLTGFVTLFIVGIIFGICSVILLSRIKEPQAMDHVHHSLKEFFSIDGDFKKFCVFAFFFNFAVMFASPFFTVFMLKNLGLSYTYFTLASAISTLARIAAQPRIGALSDKYGDRQVALISVFGTAFVPFLFLFVTPHTLWLMIIAQIVSGIVWAGADLTLFNLLLDLTTPDKRATHVASYAALIAIPNIVSPIIGGLVADYGRLSIINGVPLVFLISFILRLFTGVLLYPIKEPRAKKTYPFTHFFYHAFTFHPSMGFEHRLRIAVRKFGNKYGLLR